MAVFGRYEGGAFARLCELYLIAGAQARRDNRGRQSAGHDRDQAAAK